MCSSWTVVVEQSRSWFFSKEALLSSRLGLLICQTAAIRSISIDHHGVSTWSTSRLLRNVPTWL